MLILSLNFLNIYNLNSQILYRFICSNFGIISLSRSEDRFRVQKENFANNELIEEIFFWLVNFWFRVAKQIELIIKE